MSGKRARHPKQKPQFKNDPVNQQMTGLGDNPESDRKNANSSSEEQPKEQLDNIGFVIELFLDDRRQVRLTQALHVRSAEGESWDGWNEERLTGFLIKHADLSVPASSSSAARTMEESDASSLKTFNVFLERLRRDFAVLIGQGKQFDLRVNKTHGFRAYIACEGESVPVEIPRALLKGLGVEAMEVIMETALALSAPKKLKAKPHERQLVGASKEKPETEVAPNPAWQMPVRQKPVRQKVDVIPARAESPSRILKSGEPFRLRLPVDREAMENEQAPLSYKASVAARLWEDHSRRLLGNNAGVIQKTDETVLIEIARQELPPGVFRFEVDLEISFKHSESSSHTSLTSGFVQII